MFEILSSTRIPDTLYVNEISTTKDVPAVDYISLLPVDVPQGFYITEETAEVKGLVVENTYAVPENLPASLYDAVTPVMVEGWLKSTLASRSTQPDQQPVRVVLSKISASVSRLR